MCVCWCVFFFFFQAEDGIRDVAVTGVQTCALPILALPQDLTRGDLVRRVAHQRIGERRLARAVAAHDRVHFTLADGQVDAAQDLVAAVGDGHDMQVFDDEGAIVLVRGFRLRRVEGLGHDSVSWAPWLAVSGMGAEWNGWWARGTARSARVIESSAVLIAERTVSHRWFTLQKPIRSQMPACDGSSLAQTMGAIGPSRARSTSPILMSWGGLASS